VDLSIRVDTFLSTTLLSEYQIGKSLADLVFFKWRLKVFEIKIVLDSLNRLNS
jgi:hypothetical protein